MGARLKDTKQTDDNKQTYIVMFRDNNNIYTVMRGIHIIFTLYKISYVWL